MNRIILCVLASALSFSTFSSNLSAYQIADETLPTSGLIRWSQGNNYMTSNFFLKATKGKDNFVFSPLSMQIALGMTSELALGETQLEMEQAAALPENAIEKREGAYKMIHSLQSVHENDEKDTTLLCLANSAWLSSRIAPPAALEAILLPYYQAELHLADFHLYPSQICTRINQWISDKTRGNIPDLLPQGSITDRTSLVLVNTLYMRAPWECPFDPKMTFKAPFFNPDSPVTASYMRQTGRFCLLDNGSYIVVEIPFKESSNGQLALYIVLPSEDHSLEEIEELVTPIRLEHWMRDAQYTHLDLRLPKFKLDSATNAKEILRKMGMVRAFSPSDAEFDLSDPNGHVYISDIFHQAVFEIDELGGVGSAATGIVIGTTSIVQNRIVEINRPFFLFVADKYTHTVLFAGRLQKP